MSEELPDRLDDWPSDPHTLLGVTRQDDERTIKRAYAERIKRFKPDRFPDHFRRLREAYERVRSFNRHRHWDEEDAESDEEPDPSTKTFASADCEPSSEAPPRDDRWERACNGEHDAVFGEYVEATERLPADPEPYVRLYWLSLAFRELDAADPIAWLARGFMHSDHPNRFAELIETDFSRRPEAAIHGLISEAVRSQVAWTLRRQVAIARWRALLFEDMDPGLWVEDDFRALEPAPEGVDDLSLQCAAAEVLLAEGAAYAAFIRERIDLLLERGSGEHEWNLDRADLLAILFEKAGVEERGNLPRSALQGAALVNGADYASACRFFWDYAQELAADPQSMLDEFDRVYFSIPSAFHLLERGFGWLRPRNGRPLERTIEEGFWSKHLWDHIQPHALAYRWVFEFCIRFWISPNQLLKAANDDPYTKPFRDSLVRSCDPMFILGWRVYALVWTDYEDDSSSRMREP